MDEEIEWATAPLLRSENVGKYVWFSWNNNKGNPVTIKKIGRTNIHVSNSSSLRVNDDGESASGTEGGGYSLHCYTEAKRISNEIRRDLLTKVNKALGNNYSDVTTEQLRDIAFILGLA